MAQAAYLHPNGDMSTWHGFGMPRRVSIKDVFKVACKVCAKDIGDVQLQYDDVQLDLDRIYFRCTNGGSILIDRKANALGR